jgi:hypothetical protein
MTSARIAFLGTNVWTEMSLEIGGVLHDAYFRDEPTFPKSGEIGPAMDALWR